MRFRELYAWRGLAAESGCDVEDNTADDAIVLRHRETGECVTLKNRILVTADRPAAVIVGALDYLLEQIAKKSATLKARRPNRWRLQRLTRQRRLH